MRARPRGHHSSGSKAGSPGWRRNFSSVPARSAVTAISCFWVGFPQPRSRSTVIACTRAAAGCFLSCAMSAKSLTPDDVWARASSVTSGADFGRPPGFRETPFAIRPFASRTTLPACFCPDPVVVMLHARLICRHNCTRVIRSISSQTSVPPGISNPHSECRLRSHSLRERVFMDPSPVVGGFGGAHRRRTDAHRRTRNINELQPTDADRRATATHEPTQANINDLASGRVNRRSNELAMLRPIHRHHMPRPTLGT